MAMLVKGANFQREEISSGDLVYSTATVVILYCAPASCYESRVLVFSPQQPAQQNRNYVR